jgi:rare lipoprotein A (peptidoglycan hydrolase)
MHLWAAFLCVFVIEACTPLRQEVRPGQGGTERMVPATSGSVGSGTAPVAAKHSLPGGSVQKGDAWKGELEGIASWYGADFNGRLTASGEVYDMYEMTAAHKTLPLGTVVKVHNLDNGQTTTVRVNDRGPYVEGRVIDLSRKAARALGMREDGTAHVKLEVLSMPKE